MRTRSTLMLVLNKKLRVLLYRQRDSVVKMARAKLTFTIHVIFTLLLHVNVFLGLLHEWVPFLSTHIWILWFLSHVVLYSIYVVLTDIGTIVVQPVVNQHLVYQSFFIALWYYQRIYALNFQSVENYEVGCKRDLLVVTSTVAFTVLLVTFTGAFTRLIV